MLRYLEIKKMGLERNVSRIKVLTWSNVGSLLSRNCRRRPLVGELAEFPSSDSRGSSPSLVFSPMFACVWFGLVWCFVFSPMFALSEQINVDPIINYILPKAKPNYLLFDQRRRNSDPNDLRDIQHRNVCTHTMHNVSKYEYQHVLFQIQINKK